MSTPKTVRVDNWGTYVLQRFKHFFNRTDYCDLTLQFQDNAQLKVHRLMLSSCTEYFEVLERTCEMYEDCLVMPDDLQADVVVPIINFMYTGQLEFRMELLEKLHSCSEIMNMPVLTKLLDSHRVKVKTTQSYSRKARPQNIQTQQVHQSKFPPTASLEVAAPVTSNKRSHAKAFETTTVVLRDKKHQYASNKTPVMNVTTSGLMYRAPSPLPLEVLGQYKPQKSVPSAPRPTRYELPEELDTDNLFENSFTNISYTSQPLMIHPERTKQYAKRSKQDKGLPSTSKKSRILDIVECKKVTKESENSLFGEPSSSMISDEVEMFRNFEQVNVKTESNKNTNQLFDQLLDEEEEHSTKVTIEAPKNNKNANIDHAKIISEVLKKYPHLVKNNKNIKLKIFNNPAPSKVPVKKQKTSQVQQVQPVPGNMNVGAISDFTYETDVIDSKQAARLIALGAENIEGPWICLICGTPGRALHFTSYYKFRRHLVEVHKEKPVQNICEHCGQRMSKRNHLLHHLYSKHGVEPPSTHHFPKCQQCNYIGLNEALLVKHKLSHIENKSFRCNVCPSIFSSTKMLLNHIQSTGHKYIADRKPNHQCIYCLRVFIRENNLYAHLKTHHKVDAVKDGIIDESDDESKAIEIKYEPVVQPNEVEDNLEYHIQHSSSGNIQLIPKKSPTKQRILNTGLTPAPKDLVVKSKAANAIHDIPTETENKSFDNGNEEEIVTIDNNEYIMSGDRLILRNAARSLQEEFILSDLDPEKSVSTPQSITPSTSVDYSAMISTNENIQQANILMKNTGNLAEVIPIYVSNEDEYKALMAANPNIIFDSADENKTLTVLTTSEAAALNSTSIDLDNAQNNDMMILPDNYPLNASEEAVATDNSNIVVVYSQHVGDPNKGYQLLTTQALDPQYASGILTHNYETVSTASPVSHVQILDPPVTTWRGEIPQNINISNSGAALQSIIQTEEVQVSKSQELDNDTNDLPEVQLETVTTQTAVISQIEETNNDKPSENLQPESEVIQSAQIIQMQEDEPVVATIENVIIDNDASNSENVSHQTENINDMAIQAIEQIPESENISEVETEIIRMDDPNSYSMTQGSGTDENNQNEVDENYQNEVDESDQNEVGENDQNEADENDQNQVDENDQNQVDENDQNGVDENYQNEADENDQNEADENNQNEVDENDQNEAEENDQNEVDENDQNQVDENDQNKVDENDQNKVDANDQNQVDENDQNEVDENDQNEVDENDQNEADETIVEAVIEAITETESNENNVIPAEVVQEIHTLASEWSEEDMSQDANDNINNKVRADADTESEVEESIENIQHELAKQTAKEKDKPENDEAIPQELLSQEESGPNETLNPKSKIASLLNDWDDSQEDE